MPVNLDRFDRLIAESEHRIMLQVLRIAEMEIRGEDTRTARRALRAFEGILIEYRLARAAVAEAQRLTGRSDEAVP